MTSKVAYQGNLRTEATHLRSGTSILSDAPVDNRGKGEAFSPTDLLATSLASCALTIMGIRAADKNLDITGATAQVTKTMGDQPRRVIGIEVRISMPANNFSDRDKKLLESAAKTCPVAQSIHPDIDAPIIIEWK